MLNLSVCLSTSLCTYLIISLIIVSSSYYIGRTCQLYMRTKVVSVQFYYPSIFRVIASCVLKENFPLQNYYLV